MFVSGGWVGNVVLRIQESVGAEALALFEGGGKGRGHQSLCLGPGRGELS